MKSPKLLVQSLAVTASALMVFAGGTAAVASAVSSTPMQAASFTTSAASTPASDCVGSSAFKSVVYTINGHAVANLAGQVAHGSVVTATFELKSACSGTEVGIASYTAKSDHGNTQPFEWQKIYAYDDNTFAAPGTHAVTVTVPDCYFQVDFYTGKVAQPGNYYSTSGRLVSSAVGGTKVCSSGSTTTTTAAGHGTTTTTAPTTTTSSTSTTSTTETTVPTTNTTRPGETTTVPGSSGSTTTVPGDTTVTVGGTSTTTSTTAAGVSGSSTTTTTVAAGATSSTTTTPSSVCTGTLKQRVTNVSYLVNGVTYSSLSSVKPGDTVKVTFTVAAGCHEQLSLVSYNATSLDTTPAGVLSQTLFDSDTGYFGPGVHDMTVTIPNCMYQVDFVEGAVITHFGPVGTNNYYAGRILDTAVGGTTTCVSATETTTTTTRPVVTSTTAPDVQAASVTNNTVAVADTTATTAPGAVEAVNVSPQLATTGIDLLPVLCLGIMFLGLGGLALQSRRLLLVRK